MVVISCLGQNFFRQQLGLIEPSQLVRAPPSSLPCASSHRKLPVPRGTETSATRAVKLMHRCWAEALR